MFDKFLKFAFIQLVVLFVAIGALVIADATFAFMFLCSCIVSLLVMIAFK